MEQKSYGVVYRDRKAIQKTLDKVIDAVNQQTRLDISLSDEDKERIRKRFAEVYERVLYENLAFPVTHAESETDATVEMEAENEQLKEEHNQLQQEVDGLIIAVGKKRKHCPHQTVVQLANKCRAQCNYVKKARIEVDVPKVNVEDISKPMEHCQSEEQMKQTQLEISKLIKDLPPKIETVQEVEKAQRLYNQQVTPTDRLLFSSTSHSK